MAPHFIWQWVRTYDKYIVWPRFNGMSADGPAVSVQAISRHYIDKGKTWYWPRLDLICVGQGQTWYWPRSDRILTKVNHIYFLTFHEKDSLCYPTTDCLGPDIILTKVTCLFQGYLFIFNRPHVVVLPCIGIGTSLCLQGCIEMWGRDDINPGCLCKYDESFIIFYVIPFLLGSVEESKQEKIWYCHAENMKNNMLRWDSMSDDRNVQTHLNVYFAKSQSMTRTAKPLI